MKCATHLEVETNLRCGKCGELICPRCMVQTLVGARCRDCARLYKLPTYRVSTGYYLRAIGTALGMAIVCGTVWGLVRIFIPFFLLNILIAAGVGYAIGRVVSLSVNRKRGTGLAVTAGIGVAISYFVSLSAPWGPSFALIGFRFIIGLLALALGIYVAVTRLR